jgi:hypothetical protein
MSKTMDERLIPQIQYATPTTGATVNVASNGFVKLLINPAGSLLALTVSLPSSPSDGDVLNLASTRAITTLSMTNGTVIGALTSMAIGTFATYMYHTTTNEWWRVS